MFNLRRNLLAGGFCASVLLAGMSDYLSESVINFETGQSGMPALASRFLALFTTAPANDAGTGGTEVSTSGTAYARAQVAGALAAAASFTTSSTSITLGATAPAWLLALGTNGSGVNVYDATNSQQIGTVSSISGTTVTLTAAALHASSGSTDSLIFSAWPAASPSSGSEPSTAPATVTNGASVTFAQATGAGFGTVVAFGIYDASTSGNLLAWDYISPSGLGKWSPFTCTSASPGVLTCTDQTFANGNFAVVSAKYGGTLPTTGGSWAGILTVAGLSGATFNLGVNTTGAGDGQIKQVAQQSVPTGVTVSFAASTLTLTGA